MASGELKIPMSKVAKDMVLTVSISGLKAFRFRLWAGSLLIRAAAKVIGCAAKFDFGLSEAAGHLQNDPEKN